MKDVNSDPALKFSACDQEEIHLPGAIQPHGMMLVADQGADGGPPLIRYVAGAVEARLGGIPWRDQPLAGIIGAPLAERIATLAASGLLKGYIGCFIPPFIMPLGDEYLDVSAHQVGDYIVVELESASIDALPGSISLDALEAAAAAFLRAASLPVLFDSAALAFRELTGFDRVIIYQFQDDGTGLVVAEELSGALPSFLNLRFPASDIPRQARELYLRNPIRVIPDVKYTSIPLRPNWAGPPLDMSGCSLRSISPVHRDFLENMGAAASASVSIIKDGALWGMVTCHHARPRTLTYEARAVCRSMAVILSREITAKQEVEGYRQRIRLLSAENDLLVRMAGEDNLGEHLVQLGSMMAADGVALLQGSALTTWGDCPDTTAMRRLAAWLLAADTEQSGFASHRLSDIYGPALDFQQAGSGLMATILERHPAWLVMWFRHDAAQAITWAGKPDKDEPVDLALVPRPRTSFKPWQQVLQGHAKPWLADEQESAARLRTRLRDAQRHLQARDLRHSKASLNGD